MRIFTLLTNSLTFLMFFLIATTAVCQVKGVKYMIKYDISKNRHDAFLVISEGNASTTVQRTQFNAQFSIVLPKETEMEIVENYNPLISNSSFTGTVPLNWYKGSKIYNPLTDKTYVSITPTLSPTAQYNLVKTGDTIKLFTFKTSSLFCNGEVVPFENGIDPPSTHPGMAGGDFSNAFTMGGIEDRYQGNVYVPRGGCPSVHRIFVYNDANANGHYDAGDNPLPFVNMYVPSLDYTISSDHAGNIAFYSAKGDYDVRVFPTFGQWKNNIVEKQIQLSDFTTFDSIRFEPNDTKVAAITHVNSGFLRCNNTTSLFPSVRNSSSISMSGKLVLTYDAKIKIASVNPKPNAEDGNTMMWVVDNLAPGFIFRPDVKVLVPAATSNEDSLFFSSQFVNIEGEKLGIYSYDDVIKCSYDPNDKRSWPNRKGDDNFTLLNEDLTYTIRFQNNGNDAAYLVRIIDVLDRNLDKSTFKILASSHDVIPVMSHDSITFVFDPIILVQSSLDFEKSQGFVTFEIKQKSGLPNGTTIHNQASIIFDKNVPIVTNTTLNTIIEKLPCPSNAIWKEDGTIIVNLAGDLYNWYECNTNQLVATTEYPNYKPSESGAYYCKIKGDFCVSETGCITYIISSSNDISDNAFQIYPNPSTGQVNIKSNEIIESIEILDMTGKIIYGVQYFDGQLFKTLDLDHLPTSHYMLKVMTKNDLSMRRLHISK